MSWQNNVSLQQHCWINRDFIKPYLPSRLILTKDIVGIHYETMKFSVMHRCVIFKYSITQHESNQGIKCVIFKLRSISVRRFYELELRLEIEL